MKALTLKEVPGHLAVLRLPPEAPLPSWATQGEFWCAVRAPESLSLVCDPRAIPALLPGLQVEGPWRALRVDGSLDFSLTGILASLATPLAVAHISIFAVSTFETDYLLVKAENWAAAKEVLQKAGHSLI